MNACPSPMSGVQESPARPPADTSAMPGLLLLITMVGVFAAEACGFYILEQLPTLPPGDVALVESGVLVLVTLPAQYLFALRPLRRSLELHRQAERDKDALIAQLTDAHGEIKTLRGLIAMCADCKQIRDEEGTWNPLESYISAHSQATFTHGICPTCAEKVMRRVADFAARRHTPPPR